MGGRKEGAEERKEGKEVKERRKGSEEGRKEGRCGRKESAEGRKEELPRVEPCTPLPPKGRKGEKQLWKKMMEGRKEGR
jgi:hypothetical protein